MVRVAVRSENGDGRAVVVGLGIELEVGFGLAVGVDSLLECPREERSLKR